MGMVLIMSVVLVLLLSSAASTGLSLWLSARTTPLAVPLVAAVCFAFAFSALLLLPVDAVAGAPSGSLVSFWRSLYWVALLLGWLVTETLCAFLVAGEFSRAGRLRSALRANLRLYALALALCGTIGLHCCSLVQLFLGGWKEMAIYITPPFGD